mgnify:CR=1 FL=1
MNPTIKDLSDDVTAVRAHGSDAIRQLVSGTSDLATHGMDVVREGAHQVREKSAHLRDATTTYIQHEPVKSMLMAAAAGAALMGLIALFSRNGGSRH